MSPCDLFRSPICGRRARALMQLSLLCLLALAVPACSGKTSASRGAAPSSEVAATVNGETISQTELDKELNLSHGRDVLRSLIDEKLVEQAARKDNVKVDDKEVKTRLDEVKSSPQYQEMTRQRTMTDADLEQHIRRLLTLQKLILVEIPKTEKLKMYEQFKEQLEQAHVFHILVEKKDTADKVEAELKSGKDFAALAREYSKDDVSKGNGGDLGWLTKGAPIVPELARVAFTQPVNVVSAPVKTKFGWHVVKVTGRRRSYDELEADIQDRLVAARQAQYMERLRVKAEVKTKYDAEVKTSTSPAPSVAPAAPSPSASSPH